MMTERAKKIFLIITVVVPFLIYCVVYYRPILKNAPFRSDEFVSIEYKWGQGKTLVNTYNSATGEYHYLNDKDSLVHTNVKLRKDDIIYLHNKASDLGFWNFPEVIANRGTDTTKMTALRYELEFKYKRTSKKVIYVSDFEEIPKLRDLAVQMKTLVEQTINDAEDRYGKKK
jgi:hypothetical protein